MTTREKVDLWAAINAYAEARGANMRKTGGTIETAVVRVELVVHRIEQSAASHANGQRELACDPTVQS